MRVILLSGVVCLFGIAAPAAATPMSWGFEGTVASSQVGAFPVGTPVSLEWLADASTPNACGATNPAVGVYFGQTLTEHVDGFSYQIGGILSVGTNLSRGCSGAPDNSVELRLTNWSGPNATEGALVTMWPASAGPALLWNNVLATGNYPFMPPGSALLQGPLFALGQAGVTAVLQPVAASQPTAVAAPEPATLSLLVTGGLMMRRRIMKG